MGLRELRQDAALTQQELADKAGVSKTTIVNVESGRIMPFPSTVRKLAKALEVDTRTLARALREGGSSSADTQASLRRARR